MPAGRGPAPAGLPGSAMEDRSACACTAHPRALTPAILARDVGRAVDRLAWRASAVLIEGETGAGKSFVARALHDRGPRAGGCFDVVDCGAFATSLHAWSDVLGAESDGALRTLVLDEIGELPLAAQAALTRLLDGHTATGGASRMPPLCLVATSSRSLGALVARGAFRRDLHARLAEATLRVPPLRARARDIPPLARRLLHLLGWAADRTVRAFSQRAMDALLSHAWPGNVRELRNAIEHAVVVGDGPLVRRAHLPYAVLAASDTAPGR